MDSGVYLYSALCIWRVFCWEYGIIGLGGKMSKVREKIDEALRICVCDDLTNNDNRDLLESLDYIKVCLLYLLFENEALKRERKQYKNNI